jgi:hypothetical protein
MGFATQTFPFFPLMHQSNDQYQYLHRQHGTIVMSFFFLGSSWALSLGTCQFSSLGTIYFGLVLSESFFLLLLYDSFVFLFLLYFVALSNLFRVLEAS